MYRFESLSLRQVNRSVQKSDPRKFDDLRGFFILPLFLFSFWQAWLLPRGFDLAISWVGSFVRAKTNRRIPKGMRLQMLVS